MLRQSVLGRPWEAFRDLGVFGKHVRPFSGLKLRFLRFFLCEIFTVEHLFCWINIFFFNLIAVNSKRQQFEFLTIHV